MEVKVGLVILLSLVAFTTAASLNSAKAYTGHLEFYFGYYVVDWSLDDAQTQLTVDITIRNQGWFGFGFSVAGNMVGADMAIGQVITAEDGIKVLDVRDYHSVTSNNIPILDAVQNLDEVSTSRNATHSQAHFRRNLITGDTTEDIIVPTDGIYVIWAYGSTETMEYHGANAGQELVLFVNTK